jgi:lipoprotein-anchoring transpeptidase ErfK/SrfK
MAAQATTATPTDRHRRIVLVSIADRKLAVMDGDEVIATFPVAVGATKSPSPTGVFQIVSRVPNPTYYRPGTVIPSGKNNPLGTRWWASAKRATEFMARMRQGPWDMRLHMAVSGCEIAIWKSCSPWSM